MVRFSTVPILPSSSAFSAMREPTMMAFGCRAFSASRFGSSTVPISAASGVLAAFRLVKRRSAGIPSTGTPSTAKFCIAVISYTASGCGLPAMVTSPVAVLMVISPVGATASALGVAASVVLVCACVSAVALCSAGLSAQAAKPMALISVTVAR